MKIIDLLLQKWRMSKVLKHIPVCSRLLDIGCFKGELFEFLNNHLHSGVGIDPLFNNLPRKNLSENVTLINGYFPKDIPTGIEKFDVITILAVFEHIPNEISQNFISSCYSLLNSNGLVILTVPSPIVDKILIILSKLRLIEGMSLEEHHGLSLENITEAFYKNNFKLLKHSTFQFGMNNLFIFNKEHL